MPHKHRDIPLPMTCSLTNGTTAPVNRAMIEPFTRHPSLLFEHRMLGHCVRFGRPVVSSNAEFQSLQRVEFRVLRAPSPPGPPVRRSVSLDHQAARFVV